METRWLRAGLWVLLATVAASAAHATPGPTPAVDQSQSTSALISLGMPSPDRSWSSRDYERAADLLESLAQKDPRLLPRQGSTTSGAVFARIVTVSNIEPTTTIRADVGQEIQFVLGMLPPLNRIMLVYVSASNPDATFDRELSELVGMMLQLSVRVLDVADRFLRALPKDDPRLSARLEGLDQMKGGISEIFSGALDTLSEREMYREEVLVSLGTVIEKTLPVAISSFTPATQKEFRLRVSAMAVKESNGPLGITLKRLAGKLDMTTSAATP